jgi:hypothetical protein
MVASHLIERFAVDSSSIKSIGYQDGICVLEFTSGHLYAYPMSEEQFTGFAQAESKGRYYAANIKGKISGEKLTSRCGKCGNEPEVVGEPCSSCAELILATDRVHKETR